MGLYDAVAAELDGFDVEAPGLKAAALLAAEALERKPSALMLKELRDTLTQLRAMAPPAVAEDELDALRRRRDDRLTG